MPDNAVDVAIIGGGPAGSTCASLLLKYNPRLRVALYEREEFPRDHVGESQLPAIGPVLDEMGCWGKVEAAGFPIKVGATYRWGKTDELWDFEFVEDGRFAGGPRPGRYEGQRTETAFQVDRAVYDKILLDHARSLGLRIQQPKAVRRVESTGDRVDGLILDDGTRVEARHYVDATGHAGLLRRAMGVEVDSPTSLQNIAIWEYWRDAEWAVSLGVGGTRVQVMSLGYGWLWFIPVGTTRTSVGLVVPAAYYKESGQSPEALYRAAIASDPHIGRLLRNAAPEGQVSTTKDWSFVSRRLAGENWWLAGESAGFADPILAAGMTLAHVGARDVAYAILAQERGDYEASWLRAWYDEGNRTKIGQHIRFADFWYSANGCFSDLQDHTQEIARDAGLDMTPQEAWRWLGTGGFIDADLVGTTFGGYSINAAKAVSGRFLGTPAYYAIAGNNTFRINLDGADRQWGARLSGGRIYRHRTYHRGGRSIPNIGVYATLIAQTRVATGWDRIFAALAESARGQGLSRDGFDALTASATEALEAMICDGWIEASYDPAFPPFTVPDVTESVIHANVDPVGRG